ncbi:MAG: helicase HerA-like domain-containing protein [Candidatus Fimisoma sp.]|jgi:DNA helicase HerA-like ATPase|nr:DUF853 domain-containing protein [Bacillota bacterium]MDD7285696.1 DUF853 family protein [Bacillota bacterium]MDY4747534.1 helicase HerA-like domain-containing protein [Candidatus Fimisoma sp.]
MFYDNKIWIGDADGEKVCIEPKMANRHGLIAGATGTGKTITLKVLAESFSDEGVPVFLADIKGDLSGMCRPGADSEDMQKRINKFGLDRCGFSYQAYPSVFWDIYGKMGIPARTTISEMGPVLLAKLMDLNDTQADILTVVFKIADDRNLLLIDTKDLKSMLQYVAEHNDEFSMEYGNISKQSVAAILRNVVALEAQGGEDFFAEPALNLSDWFFGGSGGKGPINILDCRQLVHDTTLYSTFLLWLLSELFETLPEVGDMDKPRMVFFFDEAHLLFKDISKALRNKIEQVVKLIRSKGVGVYFITQSPKDIPDEILGQLGNKIQHALRAYTPAEEKATRAVAASFRTNPEFDTYEVLTNLGTGEAIMSVLDEKGVPGIVKKCKVLPPRSLMGPISDEEKQKEIMMNNLYLKYQQGVDRDSAYEFFQRMAKEEDLRKEQDAQAAAAAKEQAAADKEEEKARQAEERKRQKEEERAEREAKNRRKQVASSAAGTIGRELGNMVGKSIGGSFGKKLGGNVGASLARNIMGTFIK